MSTLYWIRRDFRLDDNPALLSALKENCTRAVFITAYQTWKDHHLSPIQADLIERHLNDFCDTLQALGIQVSFLEANTYDEQIELLTEYCHQNEITTVYANSELELREKQRDEKLQQVIELKLRQSDTILPYGSVLNKQGEMFKVFTPFRNAWLKTVTHSGFDSQYLGAITVTQSDAQPLNCKFILDFPKRDSRKWPLASTINNQVLPAFINDKLSCYAQDRDFPAIKGTSGLSPYLAIGAISPKRVFYEAMKQFPHILEDAKAPIFCWLNELVWREFYRNLLYAFPNLSKHHDFQPKFKGFSWPVNNSAFDSWCLGKTGFPIIDAAMRQLNQTGWMHNRLRMIVASFLTKHLLIDWRLGESYFMQNLIDGDLASNSGGWQWAAGSGCDAQPYFRIFNPQTQSEKFDPEGAFIRKYLPELSDVPNKYIHSPQEYITSKGLDVYWPQIIDLKAARKRALDYYQTELTHHDK